MKIHYISILVGLLLSSCSDPQENVSNTTKSEPETTVNTIPDFDIHFPETNFKVQKQVTNSLNKPTVTNWLLEGKDENGPFMYFVAHDKMNKELEALVNNDPSQLDIALQGMLVGSAEKLGGYDFVFTKIEYEGSPGMASQCTVMNGEGIIKSRAYLIDKDIFVISGGGKNIDQIKLDAFLNSFKLKE